MKIFKAPTYTNAELEVLDESEIVFPYSNPADAIYDGLLHQYRLTSKYFEERGHNLGVEIEGNNPDKVKHFLDNLRVKCYGWIYSHSKSDRNQINYMIAKRGLHGFSMFEYRQQLIEAMFLQGEYMLVNGDISTITGVDLDTMQNMSRDVLRGQDRDMHPNALLIFKQLGLSFYGRYAFRPQGKDW